MKMVLTLLCAWALGLVESRADRLARRAAYLATLWAVGMILVLCGTVAGLSALCLALLSTGAMGPMGAVAITAAVSLAAGLCLAAFARSRIGEPR